MTNLDKVKATIQNLNAKQFINYLLQLRNCACCKYEDECGDVVALHLECYSGRKLWLMERSDIE